MPQFKNPNNPEQPKEGVYVWICEKNGKKKTLYVGRAGKRETLLTRGTLFRGVSEAQKGVKISTDKGKSLDVDFIVGCAIEIFEEKGWKCYWEHIDNHPDKEKDICGRYNPILQDNNARVLPKFKHKNKNENKWIDNHENLKRATQLLKEDLKDEL